MEYKTGFTVKPYEVTVLGEVMFTDGTNNNIIPNQLQCEAYGYTYDKVSGTCSAFRYSTTLNPNISNTNNRLNGPGNTTQTGSNFIQVNGTRNTTRGLNTNCFINGSENDISSGIDNASINGSLGKALRQGEVVLGGGTDQQLTGIRRQAGLSQSSTVQLSASTTDATSTSMQVQDITDAYIELQINSIVGFEIHVTRLETGGTSGTAGNFSYHVIKGAVRCDNSGAVIIYTYSTTLISSLGVQGSVLAIITPVGTSSFTVKVTDVANVNNLWSATAYLHELRTTSTF